MFKYQLGLYGKLPAHGDFLIRDLPPGFVNVWDEWLQRGMLSAQETLADQWLGIYLTSPIWRFAISAGAITDSVWAGIMIPSVDRVGRYFPFTLVAELDAGCNCMDVISNESRWYSQLEQLALQGLDGHLDVDDMYRAIQNLEPLTESVYKKNAGGNATKYSSQIVIDLDFEEQSPSSIYPFIMDYFMKKEMPSYSIWHTLGSERVKPCLLFSHGLPPSRGITALIDGNWQHHDWTIPYRINSRENPEKAFV